MQGRRNSIANALELRLFCTSPSKCHTSCSWQQHERSYEVLNQLPCNNGWQMCSLLNPTDYINTLRPRQSGRHFADAIFTWIFVNDNIWISIKISLKFVPNGLIKYFASLVQIMASRRPGDKPLSEPMMVNLLTHICVTRPQWVNSL